MTVSGVCRAAAVLLIVAGVVDPARTAPRAVPPTVAVLSGAPDGSTALADRIAATLSRRYAIVRRVTPDIAAVVVAGRSLPPFADAIRTPAFVVTPAGADLRLVSIAAPAHAHLNARVPIDVRLRAWHARGRSVVVTLDAGEAAVDRATRTIGDDEATIDVPLTLTPASTGAVAVRVIASIDGAPAASVHADTAVRVDSRPWPVFVFDRRPSWMSTFVRRAIEADSRFDVTSRTATSIGVSTDTPGAPATLTDTKALAKFDAIVIGAPDALTPVDVASLDVFLRRRGGSVVLLWDAVPTGPAAAIGGVTKWIADTRASDVAVDTAFGALRATELARPERAPVESVAQDVAASGPQAAGSSPGPSIWSAPVGSGRIFVNGALDSWRYRAAANAAFDRVWTSIVAGAADRAPSPLAISIEPRVAPPGTRVDVTIRSRDAAGEYVDSAIPTVRVSARMMAGSPAAATPLRVWPGEVPGVYHAELFAPQTPGLAHVIASVSADRAGAPAIESDADLFVAAGATPATGDASVEAWASSRGGAVLDEAGLTDLDAALGRAIAPVTAVQTSYPMRSPWWIVPVTLLASIDWWSRRRRGLR